MTYLLDTNACIALIRGNPPAVRSRFEQALAAKSEVLVSSIVSFELWYGVEKSARPDSNRLITERFLSSIRIVPFEDQDAREAGRIRATLEAGGKPIGAYDLLIAAQALRLGSTLVTSNLAEFGRVQGLDWQDWSRH